MALTGGSVVNSNEQTFIRSFSHRDEQMGDSESNEETPLISSPLIWRLTRSMSRPFSAHQPMSLRTLGTFAGVFCPVALSMFSTLLFLRSGFLVGQAGILESVAILVLAYFILVMTVLSICAISTNGALERGGAYYMISRALGPEFGGGIGFLFFVANVLATGLYVSGFVEAVLVNFGPGGTTEILTNGTQWYKYLYSTIVLLLCLLVCVVGGAVFAKTSAFIFTVLASSLRPREVKFRVLSCFCGKPNLQCQCYGLSTAEFPLQTPGLQTESGMCNTGTPTSIIVDSTPVEDEEPVLVKVNVVDESLVSRYCVVVYDDQPFPGIVLGVDEEEELEVQTMHRIGKNRYFWPMRDDTLWYTKQQVLTLLSEPPKLVTNRHHQIDPKVWSLIERELNL